MMHQDFIYQKVLVSVFCHLFVFFLLSPGWSEMGLLLGVEFISFFLLNFLYPKPLLIFSRPAQIQQSSLSTKLDFLERVLALPKKFTDTYFVCEFVRILLLNVSVLFLYWKTSWEGVGVYLSVMAIGAAYLYAVCFLNLYQAVSLELRKTHQSYDWKGVFDSWRIKKNSTLLEKYEVIPFALMLLALSALSFLTPSYLSDKIFTVLIFFCFSFLMVGLVGFKVRRYFEDVFESMIQQLKQFNIHKTRSTLSLNASPRVARLESVFNSLLESVAVYENELSYWIFVQNEMSCYNVLGETVGLIIHDLGSPLQSIHFCLSQIAENPAYLNNPKYLEQLQVNSKRALGLVNQLKSYIKNPKYDKKEYCRFDQIEENIMKYLQCQEFGAYFGKIKFEIEKEFYPLSIGITQMDLLHIFINLFSNSIQNMQDHKIETPIIKVGIQSQENACVTFFIVDNGGGLKSEDFEKMTSLSSAVIRKEVQRQGLGLRLIRRLVERDGGQLWVENKETSGTCFCVRLPLALEVIEV